jgi:hypothetical protein
MIKEKEEELSVGLMVVSMLENGKLENNMEKELI